MAQRTPSHEQLRENLADVVTTAAPNDWLLDPTVLVQDTNLEGCGFLWELMRPER